jgi:MFS family permease
MSSEPIAPSAWSPLQRGVFRSIWLASVASNVGTAMHDIGAAWLMTDLATSPVPVALLQTAVSLPVFLLAVLAGALADVVDRRRLLLVTQTWMFLTAAALGVLTWLDLTTPWVLLALTFSLGVGTALNMPAWQAIIPELVDRDELPAAAALGGISINLARAVGPALGGLLVAAGGPGAVFFLNAASFVGVLIVLARWQRPVEPAILPTERLLGAMRAGFRYVRHSPEYRVVLLRTGAFIVFGSALWALLPVVGRQVLGLSAAGYGLLMGCLGVGAIGGAVLLPRVRKSVGAERLVAGASLGWAASLVAFALVGSVPALGLVLVAGGVAWITFISTLNVAAQTGVPAWVRGRALAVYLLTFQGGMAAGSIVWGTLASHIGISTTMLIAAAGLAASLLLGLAFRLPRGEGDDLTPSQHWPVPAVAVEPGPDDGPVLVTVEYRVDPQQAGAFVHAASGLRRIRHRDGALVWGLYQDLADPWRWLETFVTESWAEHLRQHHRFTVDDRRVEDAVRSFHAGGTGPVVAHMLAAGAVRSSANDSPGEE